MNGKITLGQICAIIVLVLCAVGLWFDRFPFEIAGLIGLLALARLT